MQYHAPLFVKVVSCALFEQKMASISKTPMHANRQSFSDEVYYFAPARDRVVTQTANAQEEYLDRSDGIGGRNGGILLVRCG